MTIERYKDFIDSILHDAGINFKDLNDAFLGPSKAMDALRSWVHRNPGDPRAQLYKKNPGQFETSLTHAVRRLVRGTPANNDPNEGDDALAQRIGFGLEAPQQKPEDASAAAGPQGPSPEEQETANINKYIDDLVQQLRSPVVDPITGEAKDSIYDTLLKGGATAGMSSATMRGVGGPLAGANAVDTANAAALPYLQQRQSLLANALNMQSSRNLGLEDRRQGAAGLRLQEQQFNNNVSTNQWAADQNNSQGILGTIGAFGGGIVGGIAGGPAAIVPGAKAGSGLLAGIGSATMPGPKLNPVKPYSMFNGTKGVR